MACDLLEQTGCPSGYACSATTAGIDCSVPGTGVQGDPCTNLLDCAAGFGCITSPDGSLCEAFCDETCDDPSLTCAPVGGLDVGACSE